MTIIMPEDSGFCPGVKRADRKILELARSLNNQKVYVLGDLINNRNYMRFLEQNGIFSVNRPGDIPDGQWAVIRTHGLPRQIQQELTPRCPVLDLTCPKVKKVQETIAKWSDKGFLIVLNGKKGHPETLGLLSYAQKSILVSADEDDYGLYENLESLSLSAEHQGILFTSQTTGHQTTFSRLCDFAEALKSKGQKVEIYRSICSVIARKAEKALLLQKDCPISVVIGDKASSNANSLFNSLRKNQARCYFVSNLEELKKLNPDFKPDEKVMVVSSASTPPFIEKEIIDYLISFTN